ncbi:cyclopropane-fatty-acyl-phospholipid synthase family protein [Rhizobium sp. RU36D]|uniref:SAM-dependent methyltransferase n=1 Tax=Rhizobium sp. RU36D TaxID=1907415 RepID=UPI0009D89CE8|nr:cyclopropane-fatty-acyl-phospholipid synthase family protein [Rhizobium sp. RU36D]SMC46562.1 cyclopropane-fatty-acyl-phospholipid synthase [Rhizobium sp. RU36D]
MSHAGDQISTAQYHQAPQWQKLILKWAGRITIGRLRIIFPDNHEYVVEGDQPGPSATLRMNNSRPVRRLIWGGSLGFARSYMDGDWDSPDLVTFLELALVNEEMLSTIAQPSAILGFLANLRHKLRRNSRAGSKRNIAFHYDLGNSFYLTWLDETMTYSSALFSAPDLSLKDAQNAKYDRIIEELGIGPDDHVLEIGCGWGGFAERAITRTGCRVTGLTLSREQANYARERLGKAGLAGRSDIRLEDYRDCKGTFSKIVSIEMFEAVGEENWPVYFSRVRELLEPGGRAMIQAITIEDSRFHDYRRNADFIQTYIFPGGMLPSVSAFEQAAKEQKLSVAGRFAFGRDYERTLLAWDKTFTANWPKIMPLGFDEKFFRMWRYYLHYCAAGFRRGRLDVVQFELSKG